MAHVHHITLDDETHQVLLRRCGHCNGNISKAARTIILESIDHAASVRRSIRPELNAIIRAVGQLRANRIPGSGFFVEEIDIAVRGIEDKLARVTTS